MIHFRANKEKIPYQAMGIVVLLFQMIGFVLTKNSVFEWSFISCLFVSLISIVLGIVLGNVVFSYVKMLGERKQNKKIVFSWKILFVIWLFMFLCWLPSFLAYFPGICSYDFSIQMGQIETGNYSDHHPFMHTLLIEFCWKIGKEIFSSGTIGIAIYSILQMLILSFAFSYACYVLIQTGISKSLLIFLSFFCSIFPANVYMSVSATKDTIFSAFVLIFLMSCLMILRKEQAQKKYYIFYMVGAVGCIWFRNNGRYAILVSIVMIMLFFLFDKKQKKRYKTILWCSVVAFLIAMGSLHVVQNKIGCTQGDRREMLSIPIQQWARIVSLHKEELDSETYDFIVSCISEEGLFAYDPHISDPVKRYTNTTEILNQAGTFISTYIKLFFKYPNEYVNAFLIQNIGFYYVLDESHAWINYREELPGYGYIQTREVTDELLTRDIEKNSLFPALYKKLQSFANENNYLNIPIVSICMAPGIYFVIVLFILGGIFSAKKYRYLIPMSFIGGYYITLVLGPTVQLRYIYPIMITVPFMLAYFRNVNEKRA